MISSSPFSIRLDPALKKRLYAAAKKDDRTVTSFVVHVLRRVLGEPSPNLIEVKDLTKDGSGYWHLTVNGFDVAMWPPPKDVEAKVYAEEVARVLRLAIR